MLNIEAINLAHPSVMMISDFDYLRLMEKYKAPEPNRTFRILEEYASAAFVQKGTDKVIGYMRYEVEDDKLYIHYLHLTEKGKDYGRKIVRFLDAIPGIKEIKGFVMAGDSILLEKTGLFIDEFAVS